MARPKVAHKNERRPFGIEELFFSTTNRAGVILSGNEVFRRVAAFETIDELIGKPHNIIRHPDMPRAVFKLLWDYLEAGKMICAYVKNMAQDGAYYWVFAMVLPIDRGYLSIRFNPSSPFFETVQGLYKAMLRIEHDYGDAPKVRDSGMMASLNKAVSALGELGFPDYDTFMRVAMATEMESRSKGMAAAGIKRLKVKADGPLGAMLGECYFIEEILDKMFSEVESFLGLIGRLESNSQFLNNLAREISLHSLNTLMACHKLGDRGRGLAVVAENLSGISHESMEIISGMTGTIGALVSALRAAAFYISSAKLQVEVSIVFLLEVLELHDEASHAHQEDLHMLAEAFTGTLRDVAKTLPEMTEPIGLLTDQILDLHRTMRSLAGVQIVAQVETARLNGADVFRSLFDEIQTQIDSAKTQLQDFSADINLLREGLPGLTHENGELSQALASFHLAAA